MQGLLLGRRPAEKRIRKDEYPDATAKSPELASHPNRASRVESGSLAGKTIADPGGRISIQAGKPFFLPVALELYTIQGKCRFCFPAYEVFL